MDAVFWPNIISAVSALLVPTLAIAAIIYARMQAHTARDKLKLDLFDKRLTVFSAALDFVKEVGTAPTHMLEIGLKFSDTIENTDFLFGPEIADYLREVERHADLQKNIYDREENPDSPRYPTAKEKKGALESGKWLDQQLEEGGIRDRFRPYLQMPEPTSPWPFKSRKKAPKK